MMISFIRKWKFNKVEWIIIFFGKKKTEKPLDWKRKNRFFIVESKNKPMVSANIEIINDLNEFFQKTMSDKETKMQYVNKVTDFTRKRSLSFSNMVTLHINLLKRSLSVELESFFSHIGSSTVTKSAFCQQRRKLKPVFFCGWNDALTSSYYRNAQG